MSILLTVLKIIGIAILIVLGLILFILLLVLFVPVRYRGGGSYQNGLFATKLRASWLLHIISIKGEYQNEQALHVDLKIFGIRIYDNLRVGSQKTKHKKVKSTKNKTESTGEIQAASSEDYTAEDTASEDAVYEKEQTDDFSENIYSNIDLTVTDDFPGNAVNSSSKILGIVQKIKNIFTNFVNFFKNIKFTFHKVCDTIVKIKDNIKYYMKVLQLDSTKRAFAACQKQVVCILGKILPRKYRINLHLGFDDPAVMGEVLAVWGMFYPLHLGNIDIQPEFDHSVIEGDFSFQGHVSAVVFARAACILFFDKDIKRLIKHLKRGGI
ncbi:MAG: hypothetical protein K2N44_16815 [Lachnospiraceae bacterium]|nr:hypothetical protein [Lachnospiraceae bacterium]